MLKEEKIDEIAAATKMIDGGQLKVFLRKAKELISKES